MRQLGRAANRKKERQILSLSPKYFFFLKKKGDRCSYRGRYEVKFLVDDQWLVDLSKPTVRTGTTMTNERRRECDNHELGGWACAGSNYTNNLLVVEDQPS